MTMPNNEKIASTSTTNKSSSTGSHSTSLPSRAARLATLRPRETYTQAQHRLERESANSSASEHMNRDNRLIASRWKRVIEESDDPSAFDMKHLYGIEWDRGENDQNVKPIESVMSGYKQLAMLSKGQDGWRHGKVTLPPSSAVATARSKRGRLDDDISDVPWPSKSRRPNTGTTVDYTDTRAFKVPDVDDEDVGELEEALLSERYWRVCKKTQARGTTEAESAQTTKSAQMP